MNSLFMIMIWWGLLNSLQKKRRSFIFNFRILLCVIRQNEINWYSLFQIKIIASRNLFRKRTRRRKLFYLWDNIFFTFYILSIFLKHIYLFFLPRIVMHLRVKSYPVSQNLEEMRERVLETDKEKLKKLFIKAK